MLKWSWRYPG